MEDHQLSFLLIVHFGIIHAHFGKVLKDDIIIIVLIVAFGIAMLFDRLHFLHGIGAFLFNSAQREKEIKIIIMKNLEFQIDSSIIPGAGCANLNGTSVCISPPNVPQFNLTLTEQEITIPQASPVDLPSCTMVEEAKLTSSSLR